MITTTSLNKMYDEVINGNVLTKEKLKECGFDFSDIIKLIKKDFIILLGNDCYTLKRVEDLYFYGNKLINIDKAKSRKCFERCYELDPNNSDVCFQLFFYSIEDKNYEEAFKYLKTMLNTDDEYEIKDNNLYLYLLNMIVDLPSEYKTKAKKLTFNDLKLLKDDIRYDDISSQNRVRKVIFENRFIYAIEKLREATTICGYTFKDKILKLLLFEVGDVEKIRKRKILDLARYKKYDELISHYDEQQKKCKLKGNDKYILKLVRQILNFEKTLELPDKIEVDTNSMFEAIDTSNYRRALNLSRSYVEEKQENVNSITFYILLSDLCEKMNVISILNAIFSGMVKYIENNDYVSLVKRLRNYLESIDKKEYEDLVIECMKLDLYENDLEFHKTIRLLYEIITNPNSFDKNHYLEEINSASAKKSVATEDSIDKIDKITTRRKAEEYVSNKHSELLRNKGIIVLEPMSDRKIKIICDIVDTYTDIKFFVVGDNANKRVVLRYKYRTCENINYEKLKNGAEKAYLKGEFDICLSYYLQLLQYGNPRIKTYARIGQCYLMLGEPLMAVDYLIVATELSKLSNNEYDFTDEINEIKKRKDNMKTRFKKLVLSIGYSFGEKNG